jgi:hypothetical protein
MKNMEKYIFYGNESIFLLLLVLAPFLNVFLYELCENLFMALQRKWGKKRSGANLWIFFLRSRFMGDKKLEYKRKKLAGKKLTSSRSPPSHHQPEITLNGT